MSSEETTLATRFRLKAWAEIRSTAVLGIRFWDQGLEVPVRSGLLVTLRPADRAGPQVQAVLGGSGIWSFHNVPGLRTVEYPTDDTLATLQLDYLLEVQDPQGRFGPVVTKVTLPDNGAGLFLSSLTATVAGPGAPAFYLFAAPARRAGPGLATVRAEVWDALADQPAAYAVLEVQYGTRTWYGVADSRGCVTVLFAYPELQAGAPATPLIQLTWALQVRVRYGFSALAPPTGARTPDLRDILGQDPAGIWLTPDATPAAVVDEWEQTLHVGQELILRSEGQSRLLIVE